MSKERNILFLSYLHIAKTIKKFLWFCFRNKELIESTSLMLSKFLRHIV